MRLVGVDFSGENGNLNIDDFVVGTNENVSVNLDVNCCVRKAILSMIDVAGNAQRADFDKGSLKSNSILLKSSLNFEYLLYFSIFMYVNFFLKYLFRRF